MGAETGEIRSEPEALVYVRMSGPNTTRVTEGTSGGSDVLWDFPQPRVVDEITGSFSKNLFNGDSSCQRPSYLRCPLSSASSLLGKYTLQTPLVPNHVGGYHKRPSGTRKGMG